MNGNRLDEMRATYLRSWVQIPSGPFFNMRELRYQNRLVIGSCPTKTPTA